MSLFPSSGFEVLTATPEQVVVVAHPEWGVACFGIAVLVLAIFLFVRARSLPADSGARLFAPVVLLAALLCCWFAVEHGQVTLDRPSGTVSVQKVTSFLVPKSFTFPLADLTRAEVRSSGNQSKFCMVTRDGGCIPLKGYVGDSGQYRAVAAVNNFLGVR